jgi:NhaP-type Na+/H+ and K+/H+ antiporter
VDTNVACAGVCMHENFKLEYQVVDLEFVRNKSIKIEAVCYNRHASIEKEAVFKHSTNNLNLLDERLKIALSIMDSVIKNLDLPKDKLYKLVVRNHQVFYICKI